MRTRQVLDTPDRALTTTIMEGSNMAAKRICSIPDCGKRVFGHGWCQAHYSRYRRHGSPCAGGTASGAPQKFIEQALYQETDDCITWPYSCDGRGYGHIWIEGSIKPASRVICERAHGEPPTPKHEAAHSCGMGHNGCVNPKHLRWADATENALDRKKHGTQARGELQGSSKLTEAAVLDIRRRSLLGQSQRSLSAEFGVSQKAISKIIRRESWAWLE